MEKYACDACRARKVSCSRTQPACSRCTEEQVGCIYSRRGIIKRQRRKKDTSSAMAASPKVHVSTADSHLSFDIEQTREQLGSQTASRGLFDGLAETSAVMWLSQDLISIKDTSARRFILFEDRMSEWTNLFTTTLEKGRPMFFDAPPSVMDHLRNARLHCLSRAWLVAFYSVVLSSVTSTSPEDADTRDKLITNLWLALDGARLFLEPSEEAIQALVLLAVHVEEFTSPALCWTLITSACRMLQALGLHKRGVDPGLHQRRAMLYWYLNLLDKGLAVIFNRPPTFHRAMSKDVPMPRLDQLLSFKPHLDSNDDHAPASFGAHYLYQLMSLSCITADIWTCLYEDREINSEGVTILLQRLDTWYDNALQILQAAAMTEKPFLGAASNKSIDIGLVMPTFQHSYLTLLLTRSAEELRSRALEASHRLLLTLKALVSDSQEVFNGIVWQLICCPFTAFLFLFGHMATTSDNVERTAALNSMQHLPSFLTEMSKRNSLAAKLLPIADALMKHAESTEQKSRTLLPPRVERRMGGVDSATLKLPRETSLSSQTIDWSAIFTNGQVLQPVSSRSTENGGGGSSFDISELDADIDWFRW